MEIPYEFIIYFSKKKFLPRKSRSNDNLIAIGKPSTQIVVSIYHSFWKGTNDPWEMSDFQSRAEVYELNMRHLLGSEINGATRDKWDQVESQPKGSSHWIKMRLCEPKNNNNCNGLKNINYIKIHDFKMVLKSKALKKKRKPHWLLLDILGDQVNSSINKRKESLYSEIW